MSKRAWLKSLVNWTKPDEGDRSQYWFSRFSLPIISLILVLATAGAYLAFTIPISVFPETNFPRVIVAIDNGVMPIDQMLVTITRPIEEAVNNVPGLQQVRSIISRGQAEVDLFFSWNVDMLQTLQLVNAALAPVQPLLPPTAKIDTHRLTFASFPILGYSLTSDNVSQSDLWELATYVEGLLRDAVERERRHGTLQARRGQAPLAVGTAPAGETFIFDPDHAPCHLYTSSRDSRTGREEQVRVFSRGNDYASPQRISHGIPERQSD